MTELSYPQRMGRILRHATEEVLGEDGLSAVLGTAVAPVVGCWTGAEGREIMLPAPNQYLKRLEQLYGAQPGRGIAVRIGRACLPYGLREFGSGLGLTGPAFRLLPFPAKLEAFAGALAGLLHAHTSQRVAWERSGGKLLWHADACPLCSDRHTTEPACHLAVGLAEEALYWLSGGKIFQVEEIACIARGDPRCTLQIDEAPIS